MKGVFFSPTTFFSFGREMKSKAGAGRKSFRLIWWRIFLNLPELEHFIFYILNERITAKEMNTQQYVYNSKKVSLSFDGKDEQKLGFFFVPSPHRPRLALLLDNRSKNGYRIMINRASILLHLRSFVWDVSRDRFLQDARCHLVLMTM